MTNDDITPDALKGLTAETVLGIGIDEPERLFAHDPDRAAQQWRLLCSHWHPDRSRHRQAHWVFSHLQDLYRAARAKREGGTWETSNALRLQARDGRLFRIRYQTKHALDVGTTYVGRAVLAHALEPDFNDLAEHAFELMTHLPFADSNMRSAMTPLLPRPVTQISTRTSRVLVLGKSAEFVALRGLLSYAGGALPPKHVAWMIGAMLNLVCYLEAMGLAHQAIDPDHLLVAPEKHALALTGGWWYASIQGAPMRALPARSARLAPPDVMSRRLADVRLDQFLARATALELLGDAFDDAPRPMQDFLTLPPAETAIADYEQWQRTLWDSFGERRFVPLGISPDDIYAMQANPSAASSPSTTPEANAGD
jgi:hypothetical protein